MAERRYYGCRSGRVHHLSSQGDTSAAKGRSTIPQRRVGIHAPAEPEWKDL